VPSYPFSPQLGGKNGKLSGKRNEELFRSMDQGGLLKKRDRAKDEVEIDKNKAEYTFKPSRVGIKVTNRPQPLKA